MTGRMLLLGSTDLSARVARHIVKHTRVTGILSTPSSFAISYRPDGMRNSRHVDMQAVAAEVGAAFRPYAGVDDIAAMAAETGADLLLAAGWHHLVPGRVRSLFRLPCLGLHASLLPRYRGGAPLNWAILNGDGEAGVSVFELAGGVDEGPLFGQRSFPIDAADDVGSLVAKSEEAFLGLLDEVLPALFSGSARPRPQSGEPSYSLQRFPEDGEIDWRADAATVLRLVRAVSRPYPGAFSTLDGRRIVVWRAAVHEAPRIHGAPGQIAALGDAYPRVVCGSGAVVILDAQFDDGEDALPTLLRSRIRRFTTPR